MEYMKISCLHITAAFNHRTTSRSPQITLFKRIMSIITETAETRK
ncbi:hypothetical protein T4C_8861 [Trichinella pseudospiralis]|uniref:Uncharacterized protein n=1 Tax=Trichinella pseudospiralis TaxID=6337 RepID=A0A0V1GGH9_TRIPS|nr:hypothetical protein T4C_8861 [Trichinella pseudospiralis]